MFPKRAPWAQEPEDSVTDKSSIPMPLAEPLRRALEPDWNPTFLVDAIPLCCFASCLPAARDERCASNGLCAARHGDLE